MENEKIIKVICKVSENRGNKQKLITIPKNTEIYPGDTVIVKKIDLEEL